MIAVVARVELGLESVSANPAPVPLGNSAQSSSIATIAIVHAMRRSAITKTTALRKEGGEELK